MIVKLATYEVTDPTVESQIIQLKDTGANVFFNIATPKFAAQAIRKAAEIDWKPAQYMTNVSASVASVIKPAGFDNAQGIITAAYLKDPTDKKWENDDEMKMWRAWMDKWMPGANKGDANYVYAYSVSFLMHQTLKNCGDELTHANVMKQAASFKKLRVPLLLPGIAVSTSADRLLSDPVGPARALQGRDLGAVRRDHVGRERLNSACTAGEGKAAGQPAAFFLAACEGSPTLVPLNDKWRERDYEQAWFCGWRFDGRHFVSVRRGVRVRRSTTTGRAIPRSRSVIAAPIAGRPRPTA